MTKAEELKILEAIEGLILEAGPDSYIRMTFAGVPEICRRNIEDDFGDEPVRDLEDMRRKYNAEFRDHDETKRMLDEAHGKLKEAIRDADGMMNRITELTEERDAMSDCVNGLQEIVDAQNAEIRKLKAEIVKLRMERMTEEQVAELYEKMEGAN